MAQDGELNFLEFLQGFRRGELIADADRKLVELIAAVKATGGKGTLTIKLPFSMNKAGQIEIQPAVEVKKPAPALGTGIYFATDDGALTRRDPNQMDLIDELERRRARENG